jgi:hypothetical protein
MVDEGCQREIVLCKLLESRGKCLADDCFAPSKNLK